MQSFARSQVEQIDPDLLLSLISQIRLEGYLQSIGTIALIYDALITIDKEIKYFWKVPKAPVDFIYFANRYIGILGAVSILFSNFAQWTFQISNWLTVVLTDYILTIRVLALYSRDRKLSASLYTFLALEAVAKLVLMTYGTKYGHVNAGGAGSITLCVQDRDPPWWFGIVDWTVQLAYGIILMVLALYKAAEYWRLSAGFKGFTLVKVLIEDQVIYFMSLILVSLFSMLEFGLETTDAIGLEILDSLSNPAFLCIFGSRMLLNLKEAGECGQNEGTSFKAPSRTVSDIEFGEPLANAEASQAEANDSAVLSD